MKNKPYSIGEIARICQVNPTTVYRWIVDGKVRSFKTMGGHNRIWEKDAVHLFNSLQIPPLKIKESGGKKNDGTTILIVDDEESVRKLVLRWLAPLFPTAKFDEAADGYEAGFKMRDQQPTMVVLDLVLPGVDGLRVCRQIRSTYYPTKVLAISGYNHEQSEADALNAGADAFLAKPLDRKQFVEIFKKLYTPASHGV